MAWSSQAKRLVFNCAAVSRRPLSGPLGIIKAKQNRLGALDTVALEFQAGGAIVVVVVFVVVFLVVFLVVLLVAFVFGAAFAEVLSTLAFSARSRYGKPVISGTSSEF